MTEFEKGKAEGGKSGRRDANFGNLKGIRRNKESIGQSA